MTTAMQLNKEFLSKNKTLKNDANKQTVETLKQLLMRPNITIKKTVLLENYKAQISPKTDQSEPVKINSVKSLVSKKGPRKKVQNSRSLLIQENPEYYPDKLKRNRRTKKIVLEPKHDYKVVAATNKRKRTIPHKGLVSLESRLFNLTKSEQNLGMSVEDLVITADEEGMNDEDFMEILTCPSPVWWEGGDEDEINTFQENSDKKQNLNDSEDILQNRLKSDSSMVGNSLKSDINFFKKFVKKRTKLENVLGNIKCKKTKQDNPSFDTNTDTEKLRKNSVSGLSDTSLNEDELLHSLENIQIPVKELKSDCEDDNSNEKPQNTETIIIKNSNIYIENEKPKNKVKRRVKKCKDLRNTDKELESNEKEIRNVKKSNSLGKRIRKPKENNKFESNGIKFKKCRKKRNTNKIAKNNYEIETKESAKAKIVKPKCDKSKNTNEIATETTELKEINDVLCIPEELPPLTKIPFQFKNNMESPKSIDSTLSRTTNSSISEFDSISDTNIKFLDEYSEHETEKSSSKVKPNNGKLMTAYKKLVADKIESFDAEDGIKINLVTKSPSSEISMKMSQIEQPINTARSKNRKKLNENKKINAFYQKRKTDYRKHVICKRDEYLDVTNIKTSGF